MDRKPRYIAIYMGIVTVLMVWFLSLTGVFNFPNNIFYDLFVRLSPQAHQGSRKVIVMEVSYEQQQSSDNEWRIILERLQSAGARQIIFSFFPPKASDKFYDKAAAMDNVIFGRQEVERLDQAGGKWFKPIPPQASGKKIITAPYDIPPDHYGVHRLEKAYFTINDEKTPAFIVMAAARRGQYDLPVDEMFYVNFMGVTDKLPNIDFNCILTGNVVTELIQDRSVIIGLKKNDASPGFQTPIHWGDRSISLVEYHGYALDTLIEHKSIMRSKPLVILSFIIIVTIIGLTTYTLLSGTLAFICTGMFFVFSFVLSGLSLSYLLFWPPLFEIVVTEGILLNFIFLRAYISKSEILKEMILTRSNQISQRFLPTGFYGSKDHWSRVINMVNQTLNLERAIFLEKVKDDHRVKEIIALNTSINDIEERRRDYERTPYATAIEANRPIKIDVYFKTARKTDQQYIVPLIFEGQIMGFWAFVLSFQQDVEKSNLLPTISRFAMEIAEMLYKRGRWSRAQAGNKKLVNKMLRLEAKEDLYQEVSNTIRLLGRRLSVLDLVFNALESAIVLYDIFGQITHVNNAMTRILKTMNIATPFKMTALDLAMALTGKTAEGMRHLLSEIIVNHESVNLPVSISDHKKSYMLTMCPLIGEEKNFVKDEAYPFDLHGILFELNDVSEIKDFGTLKSEFFQRSNARLKDGVESITNVCMMLEDEDLAGEQKKGIVETLKGKKDDIMDFITELNDYMGRDVFSETHRVFPVSVFKIINDALENHKEEAETRQLSFDLMPEIMSDLVLASPGDLKKLFRSLFSVLLKDAYDETVIHVKVQRQQDHLVYVLRNSGYGMPDDDFQRYLSSNDLSDSRAFKTIHELSSALKMWKGELTGSSGVGEGIEFRLKLNRFEDRRQTGQHA